MGKFFKCKTDHKSLILSLRFADYEAKGKLVRVLRYASIQRLTGIAYSTIRDVCIRWEAE